MSIRQDRLTFFGVLVAVVIAVLGYLQLGSLYPVEGRAQSPSKPDAAVEKDQDPSGDQEAIREEDQTP